MTKRLRIGISGLIFPCWMGRYMWDALERREDCEVYSVGCFFEDYIPWAGGMRLPRKYVKTPTVALPQNFMGMGVPYDAISSQLPPDLDLFITIDAGWHFSTRPHAKVTALIKTDPHAIPKQHYLLPESYSDYVFGMQMPYIKEGEIYLPYAYDPNIHYPEPETEKIYDVCLIGLHYETRSAVMNKLKQHGHSVHYSIGDVYDEYRHIYNQSKIAFSWSSLLDLPARVWEALAMKIPLVANRVPDMQRHFIENQHYMGFDTEEEAISKIEYLLKSPDEAKEIAEKGYEKVKKHTWDERMRQVLDDCGLL